MADQKKVQLEDITPGNLLKQNPTTGKWEMDQEKSVAVAAAIKEAFTSKE